MSFRLLSTLLLASLASAAGAQEPPPDLSALLKRLDSSLVKVEYELQPDKGDIPRGFGWGERCPNCGQYHGNGLEEFINTERPVPAGGVVLSPTQVITEDIVLHQRFIRDIKVRHGGKVVSAKAAAYARENDSVVLELAAPLPGIQPLDFDAARKGPLFAVTYKYLNGEWQSHVASLGSALTVPEFGRPFLPVANFCLAVDRSGGPVGLSLSQKLWPDDSWKGSPLRWPMIQANDLHAQLARLEQTCESSLLHVALSFRSPKVASPMDQFRFGARDGEGDENATEKNTVGVALEGGQLLVLANLKPKTTARLQRICVHMAGGQPVEATFVATLKDFGAFLARLERPLPGGVRFSAQDIRTLANHLLLAAEVTLQGDKRVAYFAHQRFGALETGWRGQVHPEVGGVHGSPFLFDEGGGLLALPMARREKARQQTGRPEPLLSVPVEYLKPILAAPAQFADAGNVPLSEADENRLAWLGIELQGLSKELARANNVSDLTRDGETGAVVTHVYPDSPAAKAGIEPGFVLLNLQPTGEPNPIEIDVQEDRIAGQPFPWDRLDQVPDRVFDQIPVPWPTAENSFTRLLTDLGIGTHATAQFFAQGKVLKKEFEIAAGPPHFDSAPRFKSDSLGLTVRDLTYEVRRYMQRPPDEPGVVISRVEPGGKAAVSGIKPFEVVTHINDQPVMNVVDFERLIKRPGELSLSIKRMATGRLVKVKTVGN
jgi:hypothetical protein